MTKHIKFKDITYYSSVLLILLMINGCGFKMQDDNAWKSKLCSGYWEDGSRSYKGIGFTERIKFNIDGTYSMDANGGINDHSIGRYEIERYPDYNEKDKFTLNKREIIMHPVGNFWDYTKFPIKMVYDRSFKKFQLEINLEDRLNWTLNHYSDNGNKIEKD